MSPGPRYFPEWLDYTQEPREIHGSTFVILCQSAVPRKGWYFESSGSVLPLDVLGSPVGPEI